LNTELAKLLDLSKVKNFIDPNLNRNSFGNVQFSDRMPSFVQEIYAGLINPDENKKRFYLDNASKALFTYRDFFVSADYRSSILKANELENKLKSKHEALERFKEKFTSLKSFAEKQNSTIDDIKSKKIILESEYRAQLEQVNERSVNLEREVEKLRRHNASAKVAFTALQYENKKLKSELVSVYTSRSWILTRPLRKLFSLLKKSSAK
jgi:vacuolar-type H+-ATPase subunit I/STV1